MGTSSQTFPRRRFKKTFSDLGISSETLLLHHQKIKHLMHDFIDGIRPLDDVLYDIQEYCEKGTSLKKIKDTITVLQGEIPEIRLKNIVLLKKQYKIYLLSTSTKSFGRTVKNVLRISVIKLTTFLTRFSFLAEWELPSPKKASS